MLYTIIAFIFCGLLGKMIATHGIAALLWTPVGFIFGLFVAAQMALPLMLGLPRALRLVVSGLMRPAVVGYILLTPLIWVVQLSVAYFVLGYTPRLADFLYNNIPLNWGMWLGAVAIIISPFSEKCRSDFKTDFDKSYQRFYKEGRIVPRTLN